jgi:hypothetical protein
MASGKELGCQPDSREITISEFGAFLPVIQKRIKEIT